MDSKWPLGIGVLASALATAAFVTLPPRTLERSVRGMRANAIAGAPLVVAEAPPSSRTYNVVLITVDTLRFDLGFMGYPKPVTPNLDALAARSAVFERAYATASYTPKALGPFLSGRYGSEMWRDYEHFTTFYGRNVMLGERIKDGGGYAFAAMCHHYFKWATGLNQGFDRWDTSAVPAESKDNDPTVTGHTLTDAALALLADPANVTPPPVEGREGEGEGADPRRFLAWFHYLDPHIQYVRHEGAPDFAAMDDPPSRSRERALYDGEVWFTDKQIGRLLEFIASQPWGKETAIVVTADHGEAFGEHGFYKHGRELWEPIVRVPLLIHVPKAAPRRIAVKRSHIDLVPTILALMGIPLEEGAGLRGKSLLEDVFAEEGSALEERDVFMDMPEGPYNELRRAVVTGPSPGLKLIAFADGHQELYDLGADPGETKNVIGDKERYAVAQAAYQKMRASLEEVEATRR